MGKESKRQAASGTLDKFPKASKVTKKVKTSSEPVTKKSQEARTSKSTHSQVSSFDYEEYTNYLNRYIEALNHRNDNLETKQKNSLKDVNPIIKMVNINGLNIDPSLSQLELALYNYMRTKDCKSLGAKHLSLIMAWKMARGKHRPTLAKLVKENEDKDVHQITESVFKKLEEIDNSDQLSVLSEKVDLVINMIKELSKIRGVGPATASAILSMASPMIPFMSDEGLLHSGIGDHKYDVKTYKNYIEKVYSKLVSAQSHSREGEESVLARDLERSWFAKSTLAP